MSFAHFSTEDQYTVADGFMHTQPDSLHNGAEKPNRKWERLLSYAFLTHAVKMYFNFLNTAMDGFVAFAVPVY